MNEPLEWSIDRSVNPPDKAFIQWKGTDVCMDLTCLGCGERLHVHGDFAYYVRCHVCDQLHCFVGYRASDANPEDVATVDSMR